MSRQRRNPPQKTARHWIENPWVRRAITIVLLVHLTAMFTGPFHVSTDRGIGTSPFADSVVEVMLPYMQMASLNRGYQFFAPEPSPTHLVRYEIEFDDDRETITGMFPDLEKQWPRLFYHRHMMLSENLQNAAPIAPFEIVRDASNRSVPRVRDLDSLSSEERNRGDEVAQAFADHLLEKYNGSRVTLTLVRHQLVTIEDARKGARIDDKKLYDDLVQFTRRAQP